MNSYSLVYEVTYENDSPAKEANSYAVIEASDFQEAYGKSIEIVDAIKGSDGVASVKIRALSSTVRELYRGVF